MSRRPDAEGLLGGALEPRVLDVVVFVGLGLAVLVGHYPDHLLAAVALLLAWMLYRIERALLALGSDDGARGR